MTKTEELLIVLGGIFVLEALSVLLQVFSFQAFRKRIFLMAPIHHHFEILGWSETKIILRFWIVASVCAAIGFTVYRAAGHVTPRPPLPGGPYLVVGLARSGLARPAGPRSPRRARRGRRRQARLRRPRRARARPRGRQVARACRPRRP